MRIEAGRMKIVPLWLLLLAAPFDVAQGGPFDVAQGRRSRRSAYRQA